MRKLEKLKKDILFLEKKQNRCGIIAVILFLLTIFLSILTIAYFDFDNLILSVILFSINGFVVIFFNFYRGVFFKIEDALSKAENEKECQELEICPPELRKELEAKQHELFQKKLEKEKLVAKMPFFLVFLGTTGSFFAGYKLLKYLSLSTFLNCLISYILAVVVFFVILWMLFDNKKERKLEQETKLLEKEIEELIRPKEQKIFINWIWF